MVGGVDYTSSPLTGQTLPAPYGGYYWDVYTDGTSYIYHRQGTISGVTPVPPVAKDNAFGPGGVNANRRMAGNVMDGYTPSNNLPDRVWQARAGDGETEVSVPATYNAGASATFAASGGGSVWIQQDGSFEYKPPATFSGGIGRTDSFQYQINNALNDPSNWGTVTINLPNGTVSVTGKTVAEIRYEIALNLEFYGEVTVIGSKTDVDVNLRIDIPAGKAVMWQAVYSGAFGDSMIQIIGAASSSFVVESGGAISHNDQNNGNSVIDAGSSTVAVNGGTVSSTGSGHAIYADTVTLTGGAVSAVSGTALYANYIYAHDGCAASVSNGGGVNPAIYCDMLYINGVAADLTVIGDVRITGNDCGVYVGVSDAHVTIDGNVFSEDGNGVGSYGTVTVTGDISAKTHGVVAYDDAIVTVAGDVFSENKYGVYALYGASVKVAGNVEAAHLTNGTYGVFAYLNATIEVGGNVLAMGDFGTGVLSQTGSTVSVGGNVGGGYAGVDVDYGAKAYVAGTISSPSGFALIIDGDDSFSIGSPTMAKGLQKDGCYWDVYTDSGAATPSYIYIRHTPGVISIGPSHAILV
jgi:hypothetical protein